MTDNEFRVFGKYYDQIYLNRKNYQNEAEVLRNIIRQFERRPSKTLLDVGCGTGEHLKHLAETFQCKGVDINKEMIKTARSKVPNARFRIADMTDFKLREKFDVVACLFSSIGYVQNARNLARTFRNFRHHLNDKGLTIVEPWVFKNDFRKGVVTIDTYENETVKLVRMATSKLTRFHWLVSMHYLIGRDNKIEHAKEIHRMLAADHGDYLKALSTAGYSEIKFITENLWEQSRGLFIAMK